MVGLLTGGLSATLFCPPGYWISGSIIGFLINTSFNLLSSTQTDKMYGDVGMSAEYLPHVDEEAKRKHRLQEARIEGYTGEHL